MQSANGGIEMSPHFESTSSIGRFSAFLAICFAFVSMVLIAYWANNTDTTIRYAGGLDWGVNTFNWHPVLMISGMVFSSITAMMMYRVLPLPKTIVKYVHAILHTATIVCICVGIAAVVVSNNFIDKNTSNRIEPNLWSLHSLLGIIAICLYMQNYFIAALIFIPKVMEWTASAAVRKAYASAHSMNGIITAIVVLAVVQTGLTEESSGCQYTVTDVSNNPAALYHYLSPGCKMLNGIGIVVLIATCLAVLVLATDSSQATTSTHGNHDRQEIPQEEKEKSLVVPMEKKVIEEEAAFESARV
eukprot:gene34380-44414_t